MPIGLASFKDRKCFPAGQHPDHLTASAGPLWAPREVAPAKGWTVIEGMVASAQPGVTPTKQAGPAAWTSCCSSAWPMPIGSSKSWPARAARRAAPAWALAAHPP